MQGKIAVGKTDGVGSLAPHPLHAPMQFGDVGLRAAAGGERGGARLDGEPDFGEIVEKAPVDAGIEMPGQHVGVELDSIAAVVIGGTLLTGGQGSVVGTLLGVLIQGLIQTYINFDGTLSSWWTKIVTGILLFAFIALQQAMLGIARRAGPRKAGVLKS